MVIDVLFKAQFSKLERFMARRQHHEFTISKKEEVLMSSSDSFSSDDESYSSDMERFKKNKNQLLTNYTG